MSDGDGISLAQATRDIAVRADAKTDMHIQDCTMFRLRLAKDFDEVKAAQGVASDDLKDVRKDLTKQTVILAVLMGALSGVGHIGEIVHFFKGG